MACTLSQLTSPTPRDAADRGLCRSFSSKDLGRRAGIRRSYSDNHLCYSIGSIRASTVHQPKLKNSDRSQSSSYPWERLVELRSNWKSKKVEVEEYVDGESQGCDEGGCEVEYEDDAEGGEINIDRETFSSLLRHVSWSDTKLFSQLAFLCNMAYVIADMKTGDLMRYYGLEFVTSSLEKKAEAAAIRDKVEQDSSRVATPLSEIRTELAENSKQKSRLRSSAAYEIAASAASYVQSRAKDLISLGSKPHLNEDGTSLHGEDDYRTEEDEGTSPRIYKPEMAACVAADQ
ncbi:UNVERIFIED_CONTAM: Phospholipase A1 PLIP1, chloroplastic [Sesamum radiatum]|uniref:Phospholipase A1 PLIP1, chloroplastic n=1 Tax=Sesamum radiatum TaxID=300843 RepID=A0AAW2R1C5_SESRA